MRKQLKTTGLRLAKALGLFAVARWATRGQVRILCYHGAWIAPDAFGGDAMFITPETFERRLDLIRATGYRVVPFAQAVEALALGKRPERATLTITIDDGWASTYRRMIPALEARGLPATLYCDSANLLRGQPIVHVMAAYFRKLAGERSISSESEADFAEATDLSLPPERRLEAALRFGRSLGLEVETYLESGVFDYMTPAELRAAAERGLDVQLHTHTHSIHDHSPAKIAEEVAANRAALARVLDRAPESFTHFCYPSGVASIEAAEALGGLGMRSATTCEPGFATPEARPCLLPRILDGENLSEIEFEAELAEVGNFLRLFKRTIQGAPLDGAPKSLRSAPA